MMIYWVGYYMDFGYALLETVYSGNKRERASEKKIELRGCWDFILGQLQKTIRLQLSLFTNYRNSYV